MFLSIKKLSKNDKKICQKTISSKAIYAIVGDAILRQKSISIVRMGDGECKILKADKTKPFTAFNYMHNEWNKKLGIENSFVYMSFGRPGITKGIEYLIVNGVLTVAEGKMTGSRAGKML